MFTVTMLSRQALVSRSHTQMLSVVPTTAHQPFSPTGTAAVRASEVSYQPCAPSVMVRTCSKYSFVACRYSPDFVSLPFALDALVPALVSLVLAALALVLAALAAPVAVLAALDAVWASFFAAAALLAAAVLLVLASSRAASAFFALA